MNSRRKQLKISILQHRIVQASEKQQQRKIRNLQRLLIKSLSARIQAIFIASKKINEYSFSLKKKRKKKAKSLVQQTKFLESINSNFLKKFILTFYKKIVYFFILVKKILKKLKKKKKNKKFLDDVKKMIEIFFFSFLDEKNSLFLLLWNSAFSPIIETLLRKKREKNFRNPSEILLFLNHFWFQSKKTKQAQKKNFFSPWILKLEIQGFFEHLNNSWLFQNFPIESYILKKSFIFSFVKNGKTEFQNYKLLKDQKKKRKKKQKKYLFHKDFLKIWNSLSSKKNFFKSEKTFKTNFDNFFSFCLIGLESYLKDIFDVLDEFSFSEFLFPSFRKPIFSLQSKNTIQIFYYPRSIFLMGGNRRQFKRIKKLIDFFLKQRGLELDLKKTTHFHLEKGFDFLGWTLKKTQKKDLIVQISESFICSQKKEIKWLIKNSKHQLLHELIIKLNKKIKNDLIEYENQRLWTQNVETIYSDLNFFINQIFWKWAKKRHNNRPNTWIFQKYWDLKFKKYSVVSHSSFLPKEKKEEVLKSRRRIFVLLYEKKLQKSSLKFKFSPFFFKETKYLYFLNFYSLDFQTQYCFFLYLKQKKSLAYSLYKEKKKT